MRVKNLIADALILGMSAALLWHFSNIWRYGQYVIQEPNIVILYLETAGIISILVFGVGKLMGDMRAKKK